MTEQPRKPRKSQGYRLAVPISDKTRTILGAFGAEWGCTPTEAARWLLEVAALLYQKGDILVD